MCTCVPAGASPHHLTPPLPPGRPLQVGDKIKYIKCVKGAENLLNGYKPGSVAAPAVADAPAE